MSDESVATADIGAGGEPIAAPSQASVESGRGQSASRSIAWSMGGQLATVVASLVSTVVLARILTPVDFGAFAFAATIYGVVQWLLLVGMGNYILREATLTQEKIDGATAMACGQGLAATLIVLALAPVAGWFSQLATIGWVTASVAIIPLLWAPESIADALWLRDGRYPRVALLQVAKAAVQTIVSILAQILFHWGVFALVAGLLAASILSFLIATVSLVREYRARPVIGRELRGTLGRFGGRTFVLTLAQILSLRVPDLLIGRLIGVSVLGHYSRAQNASDIFVRTTSSGVVRATSPRFYRNVHDGMPLPHAVENYCDGLLFLLWPGLAGLAALSAPVIHLIYGPQWGIATRVLPMLCLTAAIDAVRTGGMEVLLVRDRVGLNARLELAHGVYAILLMVCLAPLGLMAVLWGKVIDSVLTAAIYLIAMRRLGAHDLALWPRLFGRNLLLAAAAGAPACLLMQRWGWPGQLAVAGYAQAIGAGLVAWVAMLALLRHPYLRWGISAVGRRLARPR